MVRPERVELPTLRFVAARSIQLSYGRIKLFRLYTAVCAGVRFYTDLLDMTMGFFNKSQALSVLRTGGEGGIRTLEEAINPLLP